MHVILLCHHPLICRYQAAYRELARKHPSFRERSETTELIVDISLQPWRSFKPDGVILFSDILTPLPALGVPFDIDDNKGPLIDNPIRSKEQVRAKLVLGPPALHVYVRICCRSVAS